MSFSSFNNVAQNIRDNRNIEFVGFGSFIDSEEGINQNENANSFCESKCKLMNLIRFENKKFNLSDKNKILKISLVLNKLQNINKKKFFK